MSLYHHRVLPLLVRLVVVLRPFVLLKPGDVPLYLYSSYTSLDFDFSRNVLLLTPRLTGP